MYKKKPKGCAYEFQAHSIAIYLYHQQVECGKKCEATGSFSNTKGESRETGQGFLHIVENKNE